MIENIIIQAGGKGTRLEKYTYNKPKCLVSVNNLPIIFYAFRKFPKANFIIICDYKSDVIEKYLSVFAKGVNYCLIKTCNNGTSAGMKEALDIVPSHKALLIMWCDLILSDGLKFPDNIENNYVGISESFECRWSFKDGIFQESSSKENGVAGLFIFRDKNVLSDVPTSGEFVRYLSSKTDIPFLRISLSGSKEIGNIISYLECDDRSNKCRPFNKMVFKDDIVIKTGIDEQGKRLAIDETLWYELVKKNGYENIPKIYETNPLKMSRINGYNIFDYIDLSYEQKKIILSKMLKALSDLHNLVPENNCVQEDVINTYLSKTFDRIGIVQDLIPFAKEKFIKINGKLCKNVFYLYEEIKNKVEYCMPKKFNLIHGDNTFSNMMYDSQNDKVILIDPRGYFGKTKYYGDEYYDWAKLYYSLVGNYDQFNRKNFTLQIKPDEVVLDIKSNNWEDMETEFFNYLPDISKDKVKFLHALIWISLTTYAWEDYDSICAAFYNGVYYLNEVI